MGFSWQVLWSGLSLPLLEDHVLSELSTMTHLSWVTLHGMAHRFIELCKPLHHDKAVIQSLKSNTWVHPQKWQNYFGLFPRQTIQNHSNPSLCPKQLCRRSWSWSVLWSPRRPTRTNTRKDILFFMGGWNANVGSQEIPGVTGKFGLGVQNEAEQR